MSYMFSVYYHYYELRLIVIQWSQMKNFFHKIKTSQRLNDQPRRQMVYILSREIVSINKTQSTQKLLTCKQ
jgi:hypothetical protein